MDPVRRALTRAAVAVVLAVAGCGGDTAADPTPTSTVDPATAPPPATVGTVPTIAPPATLRDWIYLVGLELPAGTYVTAVPADHGHPCYWARLRSFGKPDSVIDDGNPEPGETAQVTVFPGDRGFKVSNGCTWTAAAPL